MRIFTTLSLIALFSGVFALQSVAQCAPGEVLLEVWITPDNYPLESSWTLTDAGGNVLLSGDTNDATICVSDSACLTFTMSDSYGDGICCAYGLGFYTVILDGDTVGTGGEFAYEESTSFNCPPGSTCSSADVVTTGTYTTAYDDHWYIFVPDSNGIYEISTCTETCLTKLWVYDYCFGLPFDETNVATLYYDDGTKGTCGQQAHINALLEAGVTYYIRVGDNGDDCGDMLDWTISYTGPIQGCMDPNACNYSPLATVPDTCLQFGDPDCETGPDLIVLSDVIASSLYLDTYNSVDGCAISEGCIAGYGMRDIVRFSTHIKNIGTQDYYIGQPVANPDQFTYDNCHGHWHYKGYAEYLLYDQAGTALPIGFKNGFCVLDLECSDGGTAQFGCSNMGISKQCGDIYGSGLSCQWVDITDVDTGKYTLVVRTNWDNDPDALGRVELDHMNNWGQVCIQISRDIQGTLSVNLVADCEPYTDCLGLQFGPNQVDCNGDCAGTAMRGDLDNNLARTNMDIDNYIEQILDATITAAPCNDLNDDGDITVMDAALLAQCVLTASPTHDHCNFPAGLVNVFDTVILKISDVNLVEQYVEIAIKNPDNRVMGLEFDMTGIDIANVVSMVDPAMYPEDFEFNTWEHKVIALSYVDSSIIKNTDFVPLCRVYYFNQPDVEICISEIVDIVNQDFEETIHGLEDACYTVNNTGIADNGFEMQVNIAPNPSQGLFNVDIHLSQQEDVVLEVYNPLGQRVEARTFAHTSSQRMVLDLSAQPRGIYIANVRTASGIITKKMVLH